MARGRSKARHENLAADRSAPVGPRWDLLKTNSDFAAPQKSARLGDIDLPVTKVVTSAKILKEDSLRAQDSYAKQDIHVAQEKTSVDVKKTPMSKTEPTRLIKIAPRPQPAKPKVSSADAALRAISEEQGALRSLRQLRYHVAKAEIEKAPTKPAKTVVPKPVKAAPPPKAVIERMPRIGSRGRRNLAAQSRNLAREGLERQLAETKAHRHAIVEARDRTRRNAKARTPEKRAIKAANRMAKPAAEFAARLRSQPGFGKTPVKMLMAKAGLSGRAPGKKAVMAAMTHAEKYPATKRSAGALFSSSAGGRQTLSVPRGLAERPLYPGSRRGAIFATSNTLATKRFPQGGSGIFFRINTTEVIANLTQRYPAAIRQAV